MNTKLKIISNEYMRQHSVMFKELLLTFTVDYLTIMIKTLMAIGCGSFLGGIARYLLSRGIHNSTISTFPLGTFWVNISGCFLIGLFYGLSERGSLSNAELRLFLTVGFCGGFTTFSTFSNENLALLRDGSFYYFTLYTGLSVFLGLAATYGGNAITKIF